MKKLIPRSIMSFLRRLIGYKRLLVARKIGVHDYTIKRASKPHILFYHASGLSFGGTEKSLQIVAKYLDKHAFDVSFMYAPSEGSDRYEYLKDSGIVMIPFTYAEKETGLRGGLRAMSPSFFDVAASKQLIVTAGAGYPQFPIANTTGIPIVYYNMFGSINPQKDIVLHLAISNSIASRIREALPEAPIKTYYIQSEGPDSGANERGQKLRQSLGIPNDAMVFGRIGRPDDNIFDPIGIEAFRKVVAENKNAHYIIMAPSPMLAALLEERPIPQLQTLPPSGAEKDVWAFHAAIDVLAHFRRDGETMGLNIAESMLSGNPVITHRSYLWNAHLEYLTPECAFIAPEGDAEAYAAYMREFLTPEGRALRDIMGDSARHVAEESFLITNNSSHFNDLFAQLLR